LLLFAVTELTIILAQYTTAAWMAVAIISLAVAVHQAWATNVFTMASDMFPSEAVGSVTGIAGMAGAVGGILFPLVVGFLLDTYKEAGNITGGYNILFTICGLTYLTAWLIIHLLTRKHGNVRLEELK
jgi:ACS family hexuronate transporter-like MFS transporter